MKRRMCNKKENIQRGKCSCTEKYSLSPNGLLKNKLDSTAPLVATTFGEAIPSEQVVDHNDKKAIGL